MGLRDLERRIERGVDGVLGRVFRSDVSRIELAKRVERELDAGARKGLAGKRVMPNDIEVRLHPDDVSTLDADTGELERELVVKARDHARATDHGFVGPLSVVVTATDDATKGVIEIVATAETSIDGIPPGTLVYPSGYRFDMTTTGLAGFSLGRGDDNDIVIDDDKASRVHAHIRPSDRGWLIDDADSTNGTRVNGFRADHQLLDDGDLITIGATTFLFDAS